MHLKGQLGELLRQYAGANGNESSAEVEQHFDQVSQAAALTIAMAKSQTNS